VDKKSWQKLQSRPASSKTENPKVNDERTPEEINRAQLDVAHAIKHKGWIWLDGWVFMSPSGSCHDLSAADLTQIDKIEREGLFSAEPKDFG
jgi:hypothetical protein